MGKKDEEEEGEDKEKEGVGLALRMHPPMAHPTIYIIRPGTTTIKHKQDNTCQLRSRARYN